MKNIRHILFFLFMALLILPAIQQYTLIIPEPPLEGAITKPVSPELTIKNWFDASFQDQYDDYLEQGIGFRPTLIRINNQIAFSVFDTALANGVIIGKDNYLYEYNYIKAVEGIDFVGAEKINRQVELAKTVQAELEKMGKHFLVIFAPGKGSFYPEYIPDKYLRPGNPSTNYEIYSSRLKQENIHFIDFNRWFRQMKDTSQYPLMTRTGIHWSLYGVALAVDSLVKYMEHVASIDMVDFGWNGLEISSVPRETDNDIAKGMNILFPVRMGNLAYPKLYFNDPPEKIKPDVLVIGDSYYWNIMGSGIAARLFDDNNFWFYNREAHNPAWPQPRQVSDLNLAEEIRKQDFIILLFTDANLPKFSCGFLENLDDVFRNPRKYVPADPVRKDKEIQEIILQIRSSSEAMNNIRKKAAIKKVSTEEMIILDANWIYDDRHGLHPKQPSE